MKSLYSILLNNNNHEQNKVNRCKKSDLIIFSSQKHQKHSKPQNLSISFDSKYFPKSKNNKYRVLFLWKLNISEIWNKKRTTEIDQI